MINPSRPSSRFAWLLGLLVLGITVPAMGQVPKPDPPGFDLLEKSINAPAHVDEERIAREIRIASQVLANAESSPTEIAEARFILARRRYESVFPSFSSPPEPGVESGRAIFHFFVSLHDRAEAVERVIKSVPQPSELQLRFLRDHADRMRKIAVLAETDGNTRPMDTMDLQLMALEARAWLLEAEARLRADGREGSDGH